LIFRKKKYNFNPVSLVYEEIKINRKLRIWRFLAYVTAILMFTMLSGYVVHAFLGSHEVRILENQVAALDHEIQVLFDKGKQLSSSLRNDIFLKDNHYRTILEIDTVPFTYRLAGAGGSAAINGLTQNYYTSYQLGILINGLNRQLQIQSGSFEIIYEKALEHSREQTHRPAILPVSQNDLIMISSDFGIRSDPFLFLAQIHSGLDFVAAVGKNVYATGDGIVTFVQLSRTGYGNEVVIDHKYGFGTRYAHLDQIKVKAGDVIRRGQVIGTVGQTGRATGPHLHYEVLYEHKPVNPAYYFDTGLTQEEFAQIINKANQDTI
jgi:murein DD-endopeptidase MepM/ murein hydrolase activator NlpD